MRKRGFTLAELCVTASMLVTVSAVTTVLYRDALGTITRATSLMDSRFTLRQALSRVVPLLETAYVPPIAGTSTCFEKPLSPYPTGADARDPLSPSGKGANSFLFYSPVDLIEGKGLQPPSEQTPHLYELRLQESTTSLTLQERRPGGAPFAPLPRPGRNIVHGLDDFRVTRISTAGVSIAVEKKKLRLEARVYFPVVTN